MGGRSLGKEPTNATDLAALPAGASRGGCPPLPGVGQAYLSIARDLRVFYESLRHWVKHPLAGLFARCVDPSQDVSDEEQGGARQRRSPRKSPAQRS